MPYKKKYKSILGAQGLINAPNYLAEQILFKRASAKSVTLPKRIWDKKYKNTLQYEYWYNAYRGEMIKANDILKNCDEDCAIRAINSHECRLVLSLFNKNFRRVTRELQEQKQRAEKVKEHNELTIVTTDTLPRKTLGKKNKMGKLK